MLHLAPTVTYMSTMTQARHLGHSKRSGRPAPRARLISGRLALALMSSFGALTSFYLLLSVTPMYAVSAGAGSAGAGLASQGTAASGASALTAVITITTG